MTSSRRTAVSALAAAAFVFLAFGSAESSSDAPGTASEPAGDDGGASLDDLDSEAVQARMAEAGFGEGVECVLVEDPIKSLSCTGHDAGGEQHAEVAVSFWDSAQRAQESTTVLSEDIPREVRGNVAANAYVKDGPAASALRDAVLSEAMGTDPGWLEARLGASGATDVDCEGYGEPEERTEQCQAEHQGGQVFATLRLTPEPGEQEDMTDAGNAWSVRPAGELTVSVGRPTASQALLDAVVR